MVSILGDLFVCLLVERDESSDSVCLESVRDAMSEKACVMGARMWDDAHVCDAVRLMFDSGASTHMTNDRCVLEQSTIVFCSVDVMGVGGSVTHISEKGSVPICVGDQSYVLNDVLLCEGAQLCAGSVDEPQVLIGVRKFARDTGLGLCFPSNGTSVCVLDRHGVCIVTAETDDRQLYVIDRQDLVSGEVEVGGKTVAYITFLDQPACFRAEDASKNLVVNAQVVTHDPMF